MTLLDGESLEYVVVDVFAAADGAAFSGNPLAVVLGGDDLTTEQCLTIAGEFHLSETVFPMAARTAGADYRARIFTITSELPFAGHPSVGVSWTLARLGRLTTGSVKQECGVGLVTLDVPAGGGPVTLTGPLPVISEPVHPAPLLAAMGLTASDLAGPPPRIGGCGVDFAYLGVRPEVLGRVRPDLAALAALPSPASSVPTGVLLFALDERAGPRRSVRARMFAADIGGEDPATGSAALGFGGWLAASGEAARDGLTGYDIAQGVEMGRPSALSCDVTSAAGKVTQVRVSGRVAVAASGRIRIP